MIFRILEDQFRQKFQASREADRRFMQLALTLGRRGLGRTSPNPAVGAVVINYRDISQRKLAEAALHQARDELEVRVQQRTAELERANAELRRILGHS